MVLAGIIETLNEIDGNILLFFNGFHNSFLDTVMYAVSNKWIWIPFYMLLTGFMVKRERWGAAIAVICIAMAVTVSDQVCGNFLRDSVERLRPANLDNPISEFIHIVNDYRGGRYGFPSSHAANTFTLAVFMALVFRHRWVTISMIFWALLVSYSRMYLGVHYPGDLLVGACIGSLSGYLFFKLYTLLKTNLSQNLRILREYHT